MKIPIYNQRGERHGEQELNPAIFEVPVNEGLVHQVLIAQEANNRSAIAHTKKRAHVRGGGKKPWRQKGTGRARHGSIRSPLWRGGGVVFGPTNERNFSKKINKKMKQKALYMVLSDKVSHNNMVLIDTLDVPEIKTKKMLAIMHQLLSKVFSDSPKGEGVKTTKTLIIMPETDTHILLSTRNISHMKVVRADSLNVKDILAYEYLVMPVTSITMIEKTYLK